MGGSHSAYFNRHCRAICTVPISEGLCSPQLFRLASLAFRRTSAGSVVPMSTRGCTGGVGRSNHHLVVRIIGWDAVSVAGAVVLVAARAYFAGQ